MSHRSPSALSRTGLLSLSGDPRDVRWLKASASGSGGCVEVAVLNSTIFVQDSKTPDGGTVIALPPHAWSRLLSTVRSGRLDGR